jgi:formate C-acetyltransferase
MTNYIQKMLDYFIVKKEHHRFRKARGEPYALAEEYAKQGLGDLERGAARLRWILDHETPVVFPDENIVLLRTVTGVPEIFTPHEFDAIKKNHAIHEQGKVSNVNPRYSLLLDLGTRRKREEITRRIIGFERAGDAEGLRFSRILLAVLDCFEGFADRYRQEALRTGNVRAAEVLSQIPREKPASFLEALQFLRLIHYCLWCGFNYHNTFGRFDQYLYPYYKGDIDKGILTRNEALELVEEFFISCNKDSDLYPGIQQGDNGQSIVLGGLNNDGSDSYNELSELCLEASLELHLIDPKINLRVNKNTPVERYYQGSILTKQGLGFPQYANDDIVVEALKRWGYAETDAYNYVVAACWEFIVPGAGMDIVNINALSFAHAVIAAIDRSSEWNDFEELMEVVREEINIQAKNIMDATADIYMESAPFLSLMMDGCIEKGRDISWGGIYNNYGIHGTGLSTAVDSLAAMKKYLFEDPRISKDELRQILKNNYEGREDLYTLFRYEGPKMGNNDDFVNSLADKLLNWFADSLEGRRNDRGGIFRAGTGSAMYYVWHAKDEEATPDGRRRGESLACNYSPSLFSRCKGPISIIKSFARPSLVRVANGGPLTIELHDSVFRGDDSILKVARFVKSFMDMGGHQMQINAVNRDKLIDAKKRPENYRNLIVRVWGWSGYFVELDEVYQDHIIERMELSM